MNENIEGAQDFLDDHMHVYIEDNLDSIVLDHLDTVIEILQDQGYIIKEQDSFSYAYKDREGQLHYPHEGKD